MNRKCYFLSQGITTQELFHLFSSLSITVKRASRTKKQIKAYISNTILKSYCVYSTSGAG